MKAPSARKQCNKQSTQRAVRNIIEELTVNWYIRTCPYMYQVPGGLQFSFICVYVCDCDMMVRCHWGVHVHVVCYTVFSTGTYLKACWSNVPSFENLVLFVGKTFMISKIIENLCLVQIILVPKTKAASNL